MHSSLRSIRWTPSEVMRLNAASERRLSLALAVLLATATISVLAGTSAVSQQHARELATLTQP